MQINKNNCEAYFLDYYEGVLNPAEVAEVLLFVELNPEVRQVFESFAPIQLTNEESIPFPKKSVLHKTLNNTVITSHTIENFLIAEAEGTLNLSDKEALTCYIKEHPEIEKERALYSLVKLRPDKKIVFPDKRLLKKHILTTYQRWIAPLSVAASVALLLVFYFTFDKKTVAPSEFVTNNHPLQNKKYAPITVNPATEVAANKVIKKDNGIAAQKQHIIAPRAESITFPATNIEKLEEPRQGNIALLLSRKLQHETSAMVKQHEESMFSMQTALYVKENEDYINSILLADQLAYNERIEHNKNLLSKNNLDKNKGILEIAKNIFKKSENVEIGANTTILNPINTLANIGKSTIENFSSKVAEVNIVKEKNYKTPSNKENGDDMERKN